MTKCESCSGRSGDPARWVRYRAKYKCWLCRSCAQELDHKATERSVISSQQELK